MATTPIKKPAAKKKQKMKSGMALAFIGVASVMALGILLAFLQNNGTITWSWIPLGPTRNIVAGDRATAAGDLKTAVDQYGRAVRRKSTNLEYLGKYEGALRAYTARTSSEARERYQQFISVIASEARVKRTDAAAWTDYLSEIEARAALSDSAGEWKAIEDAVDEMSKSLPSDSPLQALAQLHRGNAGFRRVGVLTPDERAAVVADLTAAAKASAGNDQATAWSLLTRLHSSVAAAALNAARGREAEESKVLAQAAFEELLLVSPDSLQTRLAAASLRAVGGTVSDALVDPAQFAPFAAQATQRAELMDTLNALLRQQAGVEPAGDVLEAWLDRNPQDLFARQTYASLLRMTDRTTAELQARLLLDAVRPTTGLLSATFEDNRASAASLLFDIAYDSIGQTTDDAGRDAAIKRCEEIRVVIEKEIDAKTNPLPLARVDGKIAFAKKKYLDAIVKFNEIIKGFSGASGEGEVTLSRENIEIAMLAAFCNREIGEKGQALYLITLALKSSPGNIILLRAHAQLALESTRAPEAIASAEMVLRALPEDPDMLALLKAARQYLEGDITLASGNDPIFVLAREVQTLVNEKRFAEGRRKLSDVSKLAPDDVRLARMLATLSANEGPPEKARAEISALLLQFPGDSVLIRIQAFGSSDDPVTRVRSLVEESTADPIERAISFYMRLKQESIFVRERATNETALGLPTAAVAMDVAKKLEDALPEAKAKAIEADKFHPMLIEAQFQDALIAKDDASMNALIELVTQGGRDRTQMPIMRARMLLVKGDTRGALQVLDDALASGVDASTVYRALGVARQELGDIDGALQAFEESYKRRPDDVATARIYAETLIRVGNSARALSVLREIRRTAGEDSQIADMWLGLESTQGDKPLARRMRATRYDASPDDTQNAMAYVALLASATPERADVIDERGKPMFSEAAWTALPVAERTKQMDDQRQLWRDKAIAVLEDLTAKNPTNALIASAHATYLRNVGQAVKSKAVIDACITACGPTGSWYPLLLRMHDAYLDGDFVTVDATIVEIVQRDDATSRSASLAAGESLLNDRDPVRALPLFEAVVLAQPTRTGFVRVAETALRANNIDRARSAAEAASKIGGKVDLQLEMLGGVIEMSAGDAARNAGDSTAAVIAYEKGLPFFARAKDLAPGNPMPFSQDAQLKRKLFEVTGIRSRADEALAVADRAVQIGAAYFAASAVRSEVLLSRGDAVGAVLELERFLKVAPLSTEARERYFRLCIDAGQVSKAEASLREGIGILPGYANWHIALGDLLVGRGDFADGAASYMRAAEYGNDINVYVRAAEALLRANDAKGVLAVARGRAALIRQSTSLQAIVGLALLTEGDREEAMRYLRESRSTATALAKSGNTQPIGGWHAAVQIKFKSADLATLDTLVTEIAGGTKSAFDNVYLAQFAVSDESTRARGIEMLEQAVASAELESIPMLRSQLLDQLGGLYFIRKSEGDCARAVQAFETAIALTPKADTILNNYAFLLNECEKDPKKGIPFAQRAVQMQPGRAEYLDTLAVLLIASGEVDEAITVLGRASGLRPSAAASLHLAQAYEIKGKREEARTSLNSARNLKPDAETSAAIEELSRKLGP